MPKVSLHLPKIDLRLTLTLGAIVGFLIGSYWGACHFFIKADLFKTVLMKQISDTSGLGAQAQTAEVGVFPLPHIILRNVTVDNVSEASNSYLFESKQIVFRLSIPDLLLGRAVPATITLVQPDLELEHISPTLSNWQGFFQSNSILRNIPAHYLIIQDATIVYTNANVATEIHHLSTTVTIDGPGSFSSYGSMNVLGHDGEFRLSSKSGYLYSPDKFSLNLAGRFDSGPENITYEGLLGRDEKLGWQSKGRFAVNLSDADDWFGRISHNASDENEGENYIKDNMPLTVALVIDNEQGKGQIDIDKMVIGKTTAKGSYNWDATASPVKSDGRLDFEELNLDEFLIGGSAQQQTLDTFIDWLLPDGVSGNYEVTAENVHFHDIPLSKIHILASLADGEMVLNQASAQMPGNTRVITLGILKQDTKGHANYEGNFEMQGADVTAFNDSIGLSGADIMSAGAKKFRARASLFISPDLTTVSDLRMQAGDFEVSGGINNTPGKKFDSGMTLLFKHAKLDPLVALLTPAAKDTQIGYSVTANRRMEWLGAIDRKYSLNLLFEDFTLGSKQGKLTQITANLQKDRIAVEKLDLHLDNVAISGSLSFDQRKTNELPRLDANLNVSSFNLLSIFGTNMVNHPVPRGNMQSVWSTEKLDLDYMRGFAGRLNVQVERAVHPSFVIDNLHLSANAESSGDWTIDELSGSIFGGQLKASARLQALTVPTITSQFYLVNVQAEQLFGAAAGFQSLRGNTNISGEIETSGVNPRDLAQNLTGAMAFKADNFVIRGFDLANLVQTVPSVRSVADVVNTARLATLRGQSTFMVVEGSFYADRGILATKGITFRSRQAIGKFDGSIDLLHWLMNTALTFQLISLTNQDFPTVSITAQDSMDNPILELDTRSLEAFVGRRKLE